MNSEHNGINPSKASLIFESPDLVPLKDYFKILPPGDPRGKTVEPDKERAPMVMSFSRHREIPIHWEKLIQGQRTDQTADAVFLRRALEDSWGFEPHREPTLSDFVLTANATKSFSVPAYEKIEAFKEGAQLKSGEVIVRNCKTGTYHHLVPRPNTRIDLLSGKDAYETSWREAVDFVVEVFPMFKEAPCKEMPATAAMGGHRGRLIETMRRQEEGIQPRFSLLEDKPEVKDPIPYPSRSAAGLPNSMPVATTEQEIKFIREELEESWGVTPHEKPPLTNLFIRVEAPKEKEKPRFVRATEFDFAEDQWKTKPLNAGETVLVFGNGKRYYAAIPKKGATLDFLSDRQSYERTWESKIDRLEPVMEETGDKDLNAFQPFARAEEIDLSLHAIVEEFDELDVYSDFSKTLSDKAEAIPDAIDANLASGRDIEGLLDKYRNLKLRYKDIERAKKRLQNRAQKLGYFLAIEDVTDYIPVAEAPQYKVTAKKGELYRGVRKVATWEESVPTQVVDRIHFLVFSWTHTRLVNRPVRRYREYTKYEPISMDLEPWEGKRKELLNKGYACYVFDLTDAGYTDENGQGIETIMARCDYDEDFRRHCALFIPAYEQRLTQGKIKTKYMVIRAPQAGIAPVAAPRVMIEEALSYRTEWRGTELGELVYSLNLAPGESRTVSVSRTYERQTETTRSITSVLDVTESRSNDLASAMETEARREEEKSQSSHWDAKASGSYGAFSASGSAGGAQNQTSKQFARQMQSVAKNAAQSISRNTREEVSATSRTTAKMESTESSVGQVTNINEGRTLNLLFYRLNNLYHGGVYLEDLRIVVVPGNEIVAGTGIQVPVTFRIPEMAKALDVLVEGEPFVDYFQIDPAALRSHALQALYETILYEYLDHKSLAELGIDEEKRKALPAVFDQSSGMLTFEGASQPREIDPKAEMDEKKSETSGGVDRVSIYEKNLQRAGKILLGLTTRNMPVEPHSIVVPSGALYLDARVGMQCATEPYSEEMRARELLLKSAEIEEKQARAALDRARADTLRHRLWENDHPLVLRSPVIEKAVSETDRKGLAIFLSGPLPYGRWLVYHSSELVGELEPFATAESRVTVTWPHKQDWLDKLEADALRLVEMASGIAIDGPSGR